MEKFSKFNDPFTGINPFIQTKLRSINIFKCIIFLPVYLLTFIHPIFLKLIFKIKVKGKIEKPVRTVICNSSSSFDIPILKLIYKINYFYFLRDEKLYDTKNNLIKKVNKPCIIFCEGTSSNNKSILKYTCNLRIDGVCCLKYSEVYSYGSYIRYLLSLLSNVNKIEVKFMHSEDPMDLIKLSGLKQVKFTYKDKREFNKLIN